MHRHTHTNTHTHARIQTHTYTHNQSKVFWHVLLYPYKGLGPHHHHHMFRALSFGRSLDIPYLGGAAWRVEQQYKWRSVCGSGGCVFVCFLVIPAQVEECLWIRWVRFCMFPCDTSTSGGVFVGQVGAFLYVYL